MRLCNGKERRDGLLDSSGMVYNFRIGFFLSCPFCAVTGFLVLNLNILDCENNLSETKILQLEELGKNTKSDMKSILTSSIKSKTLLLKRIFITMITDNFKNLILEL